MSFLDRTSQGARYSTRAANAFVTVAQADPDRILAFNRALYDNQPAEGTTGLTDAQLATLAADINANSAEFGSIPHNSDGAFEIAAAYNTDANPAFVVWKTSVSIDEIMNNGFVWTAVDGLTNGKARIWEWMFGGEDKSINPSKPNIRAGIAEVWKGTAADLAVQATVLGHCKRPATRIEALFATGLGTVGSPSTLVVVDQNSNCVYKTNNVQDYITRQR